MQAAPLSRRDALRGMLRASSALALAVMVGCDAQASSEPTRAVSTLPASPTREAPTAPARTPTAAPPTSLRRDIVPSQLTIWRLGIDAAVGAATTARGADGHLEIVVPESGVVTPNPTLGERSTNNAWIVGHSRWHRVPQLLYTLARLDPGDTIDIGGIDGDSGRPLPSLRFEVEELVLTDTDTTAERVYGPTPALPRLIIQTSARQTYDPDWILDRELILGKAEVDLAGPMDDLGRYLLLLVVARISNASLLALAAI